MIKEWIDQDECTGCAACANICPKNAIEMKKDRYGFVHPIVSSSNCIDCGMCEKVCLRRLFIFSEGNFSAKGYAAWSKDETIRFKSTSGGIFSELALAVIAQDGMIFGAGYKADNLVYHMGVSDEKGIAKLRQSKYIQSEIGLVFREIKAQLIKNIPVLFCGTPCQVAALKAYLDRDYENLITIDFVCRGVNSPKAYQSWLKEIEDTTGKKITKVWFKYKEGGWKSSPTRTRIEYSDGSNQIFNGKDNAFMEGYLGPNLYIRPSCGQCSFKGISRVSDITLGDFWGVKEVLDEDKGTSLVIVNSSKGVNLYESIKPKIESFDCTIRDMFGGNVCINDSVPINPKAKRFLHSLDHMSFNKCLSRFSSQKKPFARNFYSRVKAIIRRQLKK